MYKVLIETKINKKEMLKALTNIARMAKLFDVLGLKYKLDMELTNGYKNITKLAGMNEFTGYKTVSLRK